MEYHTPPSFCNVVVKACLPYLVERAPDTLFFKGQELRVQKTGGIELLLKAASWQWPFFVQQLDDGPAGTDPGVGPALLFESMVFKNWQCENGNDVTYSDHKWFSLEKRSASAYCISLGAAEAPASTEAAVALVVQKLQLLVTYSDGNPALEVLPNGWRRPKKGLLQVTPQLLSKYEAWCRTEPAQRLMDEYFAKQKECAGQMQRRPNDLPPPAAAGVAAVMQQAALPTGDLQPPANHSAGSHGPDAAAPATGSQAVAAADGMAAAAAAAAAAGTVAAGAAARGRGRQRLPSQALTSVINLVPMPTGWTGPTLSSSRAGRGRAAVGEGSLPGRDGASSSPPSGRSTDPEQQQLQEQGLRRCTRRQAAALAALRQRSSSCSDAEQAGRHLGLSSHTSQHGAAAGGTAEAAGAEDSGGAAAAAAAVVAARSGAGGVAACLQRTSSSRSQQQAASDAVPGGSNGRSVAAQAAAAGIAAAASRSRGQRQVSSRAPTPCATAPQSMSAAAGPSSRQPTVPEPVVAGSRLPGGNSSEWVPDPQGMDHSAEPDQQLGDSGLQQLWRLHSEALAPRHQPAVPRQRSSSCCSDEEAGPYLGLPSSTTQRKGAPVGRAAGVAAAAPFSSTALPSSSSRGAARRAACVALGGSSGDELPSSRLPPGSKGSCQLQAEGVAAAQEQGQRQRSSQAAAPRYSSSGGSRAEDSQLNPQAAAAAGADHSNAGAGDAAACRTSGSMPPPAVHTNMRGAAAAAAARAAAQQVLPAAAPACGTAPLGPPPGVVTSSRGGGGDGGPAAVGGGAAAADAAAAVSRDQLGKPSGAGQVPGRVLPPQAGRKPQTSGGAACSSGAGPPSADAAVPVAAVPRGGRRQDNSSNGVAPSPELEQQQDQDAHAMLDNSQAPGQPMLNSSGTSGRARARPTEVGTSQQPPNTRTRAAAAAGALAAAASSAPADAAPSSRTAAAAGGSRCLGADAGGRGVGEATPALPAPAAAEGGVPAGPPATGGDNAGGGGGAQQGGAAAAAGRTLRSKSLMELQPSSSSCSRENGLPRAAAQGRSKGAPAAADAAGGPPPDPLSANASGRSRGAGGGSAAAAGGRGAGAVSTQQEPSSGSHRRDLPPAPVVRQQEPSPAVAQVLPAAGGAAPAALPPGDPSSSGGADHAVPVGGAGGVQDTQWAPKLEGSTVLWEQLRPLGSGACGDVFLVPVDGQPGHIVVKQYKGTALDPIALQKLTTFIENNTAEGVMPPFQGIMPEILGARMVVHATTGKTLTMQLLMEYLGPDSKDMEAVLKELLAPPAALGGGDGLVFSGLSMVPQGSGEVAVFWYERSLTGWQLHVMFVPVLEKLRDLHSLCCLHRDLKTLNLLVVSSAALRNGPHAAAVKAAKIAEAAAEEVMAKMPPEVFSREAAFAAAAAEAKRVFKREMERAVKAAAEKGESIPDHWLEVRLLDHDGIAHYVLGSAADVQANQQPAPVSMFFSMYGTPGKLAPEVAAELVGGGGDKPPGRAAADAAKTRASDIFQLGIYLLQLYMGCPDGVPLGDLIRRDNLPQLLDLLDPPLELRQVIEACCHKDPAQRPTADELLASFAFCCRNHPTVAAWGKIRPDKVTPTTLCL